MLALIKKIIKSIKYLFEDYSEFGPCDNGSYKIRTYIKDLYQHVEKALNHKYILKSK